MPPNIKFPGAFADDTQLERGHPFSRAEGDRHEDAEGDDFFLHDVEDSLEQVEAAAEKEREDEDEEHSDRKALRRYIKKMSSLISDPNELDIDQARLQKALQEVGEHSPGVDAIAVWEYDDETGQLFHSKGGWWRSEHIEASSALSRLEDPTHKDYVPPLPVAPGVDLAGILWAESSHGDGKNSRVSSVQSMTSLHWFHREQDLLSWRDIHSLLEDQDAAKGPRLKLLEEAGFTSAAAMFFQQMHHSGMVIFLARGNPRGESMRCLAHASYLRQAVHYIGATYALSDARRASLASRLQLKGSHPHLNLCECNACVAPAGATEEMRFAEKESVSEPTTSSRENIICLPSRTRTWVKKLRGGQLQIPPPLSFRQALWTIFGSFVGLLVLSSLNEYYQYLSEEEYYLLIGPFGALMTLQYGLTAAPASQPRNAVLGQAIAGAVSLSFTYIPESILATWLRRAVGPAFAIGAMVKLGITHPPAGAHAVLYASGQYNFAFYILVVFSTAISVLPATFVNNMSNKRQYPTYWGIIPSWIAKKSTEAKASCL